MQKAIAYRLMIQYAFSLITVAYFVCHPVHKTYGLLWGHCGVSITLRSCWRHIRLYWGHNYWMGLRWAMAKTVAKEVAKAGVKTLWRTLCEMLGDRDAGRYWCWKKLLMLIGKKSITLTSNTPPHSYPPLLILTYNTNTSSSHHLIHTKFSPHLTSSLARFS